MTINSVLDFCLCIVVKNLPDNRNIAEKRNLLEIV